MKKFLSFFIVASIFLSFGFTNRMLNASPKSLEVFNQAFKNATEVKWFVKENQSMVFFTDNGIRTTIAYDKDGDFLFSRRYYSENNLPFNILLKIKEKYANKKIAFVVEDIQDDTVVYTINLEDEAKTYVIESDGNANMRLRLKFKRQ